MATFIIKDDEQLGPYEDSFVFTKLKSGEFSYDDFCWREGMEEWKPLRTIFEPPLSVPPKFSKKTASKAVTTKTEPEPHSKQYGKGSLFLGLYFPKELKLKVAAAAKKEGRSMSNFATRVFEEYFSKTKD